MGRERSAATGASPPLPLPAPEPRSVTNCTASDCWLALTTGMRCGELLALRWSDLDLEASSLQVRRTVSHIAVDGHHKFCETEPKTAAGKRTLPLPRMVVEALKHHRRSQIEARSQAGAAWIDLDLVFPDSKGKYQFPSHVLQAFKKALRRAMFSICQLWRLYRTEEAFSH